jgi:hypothetical protein
VVAAEGGVSPALDDGEGRQARGGVAAAAVPAKGAVDGFGRGLVRGIAGNDMVERHGDIDAEGLLDFHGELGRVVMLGAVDVGAEADAVFGDFAEAGEGEDLEAAAIGEDRAVPPHEAVDAAEPLDEAMAGPEVEVVGVDEDDAGAGFDDLRGEEGFDGGEGADRHEYGGFDDAVGGMEPAGARGDRAERAAGEFEPEGCSCRHGRVTVSMA